MPRGGHSRKPTNGRQFNRNNKQSKGNKFFKHGVQKKKDTTEVPKFIKNFKYSQRNKETEDALKRQTLVEHKYKRRSEVFQNRHLKRELEEAVEEPEEENYYDTLVSALGSNRKSKAIESSDDDESMDEDEEDSVGSAEQNGSEVDQSSDDENETKRRLGPEEKRSGDSNNGDIADNDSDDMPEEESDDNNDIVEEQLDYDGEEPNVEGDAYINCFKHNITQDLVTALQEPSPENVFKKSRTWPLLGKLLMEVPKSRRKESKREPKTLLDAEEKYADEGEEPVSLHGKHTSLDDVHIKSKLQRFITVSNKLGPTKANEQGLTALQWEFLSLINKYQDVYLNQRTFEMGEELRFIYTLHALNHVLKNRAEVIRHNSMITRSCPNIENEIKDQGLVRPKVLILLPLKDAAFRTINMLLDLLFADDKKGGKVMNYKRFVEEFSGDELHFSKTKPKPDDYQQIFRGNTNDNFRIGLSLTKKCVKLFSDFYSSDILVASPLGLRMIIGAPGDENRDYDFLSSIEVLILDQLEVMYAQNWDHLLHIFDHLHLQPQSRDNTDYSRVRPWALNGWAKFYRQTILLAGHDLPEFRSIYNSRCQNYRGQIRQTPIITLGCIRLCAVQVPQTFHRVEVPSIEGACDARFNHFITTILPKFNVATMAHCLIYIPSYFDFVRIRNYFKKTVTATTVQVCEYTQDGKVARARDMFYHSGAHFMLYTERSHFFRRPQIKGIRHLIFYQPPTWPHFYPELVNLMQEAYQNPRDGLEHNMTVTVLYSKYDIVQLSGILSTANAHELVTATKKTHLFITEK